MSVGHSYVMNRLSPQAINASLFVVVRFLSLLVPLMTLPLLGRALSPKGMGLLAYVQAIGQYACVIVECGFNVSAISTVARLRHDAEQMRRLFWSLTLFRSAGFIGCSVLMLGYAKLGPQQCEESVVILLSIFLVGGSWLTPTWLYQGLERGVIFSVLSLLPRLATFPLIALFVSQPDDTPRAALILYGAEFFGGASLFAYAWARLVPGRPCMSRRIAIDEAKRAFNVWLGALIGTCLNSVTPIFLKHWAGLNAVGIYSAADRLVRVFNSFVYPIVEAYQAEVTRQWGERSDTAMRTVRRLGGVLLFAAAMFFIAMQVLAPVVISTVFGPLFGDAAGVLRVAAAWPFFAAATSLSVYFAYLARGRSRALRTNYVFGGLVQLAVLPSLISHWQATGAAVALVATQLVLSLLMFLRSDTHLAGAIRKGRIWYSVQLLCRR